MCPSGHMSELLVSNTSLNLIRAYQEGHHTGVIFVMQRNDAKAFYQTK